MTRRSRWLLLAGLAFLLLLLAPLALLQIPAVATWAAGRLVRLAPLAPGVEVTFGRVSGNWIGGLELEDVRLRREERELARVRSIRLRYDLRRLAGADRWLGRVVVEGAAVHARRDSAGWDIARLLQPSADTATGGSFGIGGLELRDVDLLAEVGPDSVYRVEDLELRARNIALGDPVLATVDTVHARLAPPSDPPLWLTLAGRGEATAELFTLDPFRMTSDRSRLAGRLVLPRDPDIPRIADKLSVRISATPLALADLAAVVPAVRAEGALGLEIRAEAEGQLATGQVTGQLDGAALRLEGGTLLGSRAPAEYRVKAAVRDLDPSRLVASAPPGRINADLHANVRGPALAEADGDAELRLRDSRVGGTALRDLTLRADLQRGRADLDFRALVDSGRVRATGWARPFDSIPSYRLAGTASHLPGTDSLVRLLAGARGKPYLDLSFRLSGRGISAADARVSARAELAAVRRGGEREPLGGATLTLAERRIDGRPELLVAGGRVRARLTGRLDEPVAYELRRGVIDGVDLGRLMGDTVAAPVSGTFTLRGRGTAPDSASIVAQLALNEIRYGTRRIERVSADVRLDSGRARLALRGGLQGGRLAVNAVARPFDSVPTFALRRATVDSVDLGTLMARPDLAGPVTARLTGSGRWGEQSRAFDGRMVVEPSRLGRIDLRSGELDLALDGERLRYAGSLISSAGALAIAGDGSPLAETPTLAIRRGRIDSLDLGALLARPDLATRLNGRFTASTAGTAPDSMRARLELELLPSRVNQAEIRSGHAGLSLDRGALRGDLRVDAADGDLVTRLEGSTAAPRRRLRAEGALRLERLTRWTGNPDHDGRLAARFTLDGAADSAGLLGLAGTITAEGAVDSARLDTLQIALSPEAGVLRVDTIVVRSNVATMDGGGRIALRESPATDTLRLAARLGDIAPLADVAGMDSISLDSARMRVVVTGPTGRRRVAASGEARRLLYAGNQVDRLTLNGAADLDSTGLAGAAGRLDVQGGALGTIVVQEARLVGRYDSVVVIEANAVLRDSIVLDAAMRGTVSGDTLEGTLDRMTLAEGGRRWLLERPAGIAVRPRQLQIDYFGLRDGEHRIALDGKLDRAGVSDLALEVRGLDLGLPRSLGLAPVGGTLDANLRLTGPAATPELKGKVLALIRPGEGDQLGRIESDLDWTAAGLRLDAAAAQPAGGRLTMRGTLPLRLTLAPEDTASAVGVTRQPDDTLGLTVHADSFDLAFVQPFLPEGTAEELAGRLAVDGRVSGTMKTPRADGTVSLAGFGVVLPALGVRYREGELAGTLAGDRFQLERLQLESDNGGRLTAQGTIRLAPLDDPALALTAELREFRVSHSATLRTIASGRLSLTGTAATPELTGSLVLGRTDVITGTETAAAAGVEEVRLTPADLQQLARQFGPRVLAQAEAGPGLVERFRLDLNVRLPRRVWFRRRETPKMDIEIAGRMRVRQEPGEPMRFYGEVEPLPGRGSIELYGRSFRLVDGEITLAGPVEATTLDVKVEYQVPTQADPGDEGILIDVAATGRPDSLQLEFTSEPTMTQDDIVSYIVTGRPASENPLAGGGAGGESAGEVGADIALTRLSESLSGAAGEALGLDVFQIRQDGLRGLTLTAGRYISSRLFLSLQQPIQLGSDARSGASSSLGPGFELEYTTRRWLRANLRGGNVPPRFFFRGRYAF